MKAKVKFTKKFGDSVKGDEKIFRISFARKLEFRKVAKIIEVFDEKSREQLKKQVAELDEKNAVVVGEVEKLKAEKKEGSEKLKEAGTAKADLVKKSKELETMTAKLNKAVEENKTAAGVLKTTKADLVKSNKAITTLQNKLDKAVNQRENK